MLNTDKHNYQEDYRILQSIKTYIHESPETFFSKRFIDYKITYTDHSIELIKTCLENIEKIDNFFPFINLALMLTACSTTVHDIVYEPVEWITSIYDQVLDEMPEEDEDKQRMYLAYMNTMMVKVESLSSLFSVMGVPLSYIYGMFNETKEEFILLFTEFKNKLLPYCSNEIVEKLFEGSSTEEPFDKKILDNFYKKYIELTSTFRDKVVNEELTNKFNNQLYKLETLFGEMPNRFDDNLIRSFDDIDLPIEETKG